MKWPFESLDLNMVMVRSRWNLREGQLDHLFPSSLGAAPKASMAEAAVRFEMEEDHPLMAQPRMDQHSPA